MRVLARKIASKSTEFNNNHKNNINSCNFDEGICSINPGICLHKKVNRVQTVQEKKTMSPLEGPWFIWAVLKDKDRHHAYWDVKLAAVFAKGSSPEIVAAVLTVI